jgi:multidrug efflux pump subunit AcrA (membrane-fusion protein)
VPEGAFILPGMIANVISSTPGDGALILAPLSAIAAAPDGTPFVFLVDEAGKVSEQAVELGAARGADVVVQSGLSAGDMIVAAGVSEVLDGMTIRPIRSVGN